MSAKLPKLRRRPTPDWQKKRLQRWLLEWDSEQALRTAETTAITPDIPRVPKNNIVGDEVAPVSQEARPAVGQIRLLLPNSRVEIDRPIYVAVLEKLTGDRFLLAPYGRFSEPATERELLTEREDPPLRVLCLWNSLSVSETRATKSWLIGEMAETDLHDALSLLHHVSQADSLPEELSERIGPPIFHHADPRIAYLREEARLGVSLAEKKPLEYPLPERTNLPKAADPRAPYGSDEPEAPDKDE